MALPARRRSRSPFLERCRARGSLILVCALASPIASFVALPVAHADGATEAPGYKQHMENGVKVYEDKNYEAALVEFEAAYGIKKKPGPLLNIALCHKKLFNYPKAIRALETAL